MLNNKEYHVSLRRFCGGESEVENEQNLAAWKTARFKLLLIVQSEKIFYIEG